MGCLGPFTSATPSHVIDPALVPLPDGDDKDLHHPPTVAKSVSYSATIKTTGACRKAKANQATDAANLAPPKRKILTDLDPEGTDKPSKRGRPTGVGNYMDDDLMSLLDLVEDEKPLGQHGWN
jgi:hypothetical protein